MSNQDVAELAESTALGIASSVARCDKIGASVMLHSYFEDLAVLGISPLEGWSVLARFQTSLINNLLGALEACDVDPVALLSEMALQQQAAHAR